MNTLLTTFNTQLKWYIFLQIPYSLKMSKDFFQIKIGWICERCSSLLCICNDLFVYSKNTIDHDANLFNLMQVVQKIGLVLNSSKCHIKLHQLTFYGTVLSSEGIKHKPEKIQGIMEPLPHMMCNSSLPSLAHSSSWASEVQEDFLLRWSNQWILPDAEIHTCKSPQCVTRVLLQIPWPSKLTLRRKVMPAQ